MQHFMHSITDIRNMVRSRSLNMYHLVYAKQPCRWGSACPYGDGPVVGVGHCLRGVYVGVSSRKRWSDYLTWWRGMAL